MPDRFTPRAFMSLAESIVSWRRLPMRRYLFAGGCVGVATVIRYALQPVLEDTLYFTVFFPAIALAAAIGGLLPGLLAVVISDLIVWYVFIPPHFELRLAKGAIVPLGGFLVMGSMLAALA